jgi:hypothetical protein
MGRSLLFSFELLGVEFELFTFKNVTIKTARLSRARGNASKKGVLVELISKSLFNLANLLSVC